MLTKENKLKQVKAFSTQFEKAQGRFIVQFKGLSVQQMTDLRFKLRSEKAEMRVIRNTLSKRVLGEDTKLKEMADSSLKGPNAFVFAFGDISKTAKVLSEFAEDTSILKLKQAIVDHQILSEKQVQQLADLPSLDELRVKLLSLLITPARSFVSLMSEVPAGCVRVLNNRVHQEKNKSN